MKPSYDDIVSRLGEPVWYDEHGAPRYCEPDPKYVCVYARYVALLRVECQHCDRSFLVVSAPDHYSPHFQDIDMTQEDPWDRVGSFHYGDPPRHGCIGDTMNSVPVEVVKRWNKT